VTATANHRPALELIGVGHRYGRGVVALRDVNLTVEASTFTLILGPNGAGKTTLANIMGGLLKPTAGQIRAWGAPTRYRESAAFNSLGIFLVPEHRRLFYRLTVRENIMLGAYAIREPRAALEGRLRSMLELFPSAIRDRLELSAGSVSGGEQQLVAIARALIANPKLVILDEPSLGLAPRAIETVYELLAAAGGGGTTIVVIEQSGAVALRYATHIAILDRGAEVYHGAADSITPEQILEIGYVGRAADVVQAGGD
jgi:branched-chain amino acid transport system ATP-binding protein